jgi:GntR family transcriptional regulator
LSFQEVPAPQRVAEALELAPSSDVVEVRGIRFGADGCISLQQTFLVLDIGRQIANVDLAGSTIISVVQEHAKVVLDETLQAMTAEAADEEVAELLEVPKGSPLLHIERLYYSRDRGPIELTIAKFRPDRYRHITRLRRTGK